jgi:TRAP-type C4-dicarboxylate transport system permease small subunit
VIDHARRALLWGCGGIAALALLSLMGLTLVDVLGRKLFATSLPGALELTELLMVAVIFASLPLVALAGEHVVFDSLDSRIPPKLRRVQRAAIDLLCAVLLAGLAWLMWGKAGQMAEFGDTTAQLRLPLAPFVHGMSVLLAVAAAVQLMLVAVPVGHHHAGVDDGSPADAPKPGAAAT